MRRNLPPSILLTFVIACAATACKGFGQGAACTNNSDCRSGLQCLANMCLRTADTELVLSPPATIVPKGARILAQAFLRHPFFHGGVVTLSETGADAIPDDRTILVGDATVTLTALLMGNPTWRKQSRITVAPFTLAVVAGGLGGPGDADGAGTDARFENASDAAALDDGRIALLTSDGVGVYDPQGGNWHMVARRTRDPADPLLDAAAMASEAGDAVLLQTSTQLVRVHLTSGTVTPLGKLQATPKTAPNTLAYDGHTYAYLASDGVLSRGHPEAGDWTAFALASMVAYDRFAPEGLYLFGTATTSMPDGQPELAHMDPASGAVDTLACKTSDGKPLPLAGVHALRVAAGVGWLSTATGLYRLTFGATCTADAVVGPSGWAKETDGTAASGASGPLAAADASSVFVVDGGVLQHLDVPSQTLSDIVGSRSVTQTTDTLDGPRALASDAGGRAALLDRSTLRLLGSDDTLQTLLTWDSSANRTALAMGSDGQIYVGSDDCLVERVDPNAPIATLTATPVAGTAGDCRSIDGALGDARFSRISAMTSGSDALGVRAFLADQSGIRALSDGGVSTLTPISSLFGSVLGMALTGSKLVVTTPDSLFVIDATSGAVVLGPADNTLLAASALGPADDGSVWAATPRSVARIYVDALSAIVFAGTPATAKVVLGSLPTTLNFPRAVAARPDGTLLIADSNEGSILALRHQ